MIIFIKEREGKESKRLLNLLSGMVNYDGDYEKYENQDNTIYFATKEKTTKSKKTTWYKFFGLVKSNSSNQSLEYIYNVQCENQPDNCSCDLETIEQKVKEIMKTVEFKDMELESGES